MEKTKGWSDMMIDMGYEHAKMCNENSVGYIQTLVSGTGMRMIMTTVYNSLVAKKKISKIEDLSLEEKNTLWLQTKEFANNTLSLAETIKLSKSLYTLEYLLQ